ncbi:neurofilament heavy polypeptide-like isoform X4 [Daphnia pulex]|uniref:neurofilament heavy polypeptide-like isoform X4 n=1 Tax=Daphnia pulex TaxID=6669 RepID=UPI001EDCF76E|nr:neurofilament heavy polypeptide-like isoform X4 [Daphnia pulex]
MTRYARANGSKSCNARVSADPTPWSEMVSPKKRAADSIENEDVTTPKKEKKTPKKTPKVVKLEPGTPKSLAVLKSPVHETSPLVATTSAKKAKKTPLKQKAMETPKNANTPQAGKLSQPSPVLTRSARKKKVEANALLGTPSSKVITPTKAVKGTNLNAKTTPKSQKNTKGKKEFKLELDEDEDEEMDMDSDDLDSDDNMGGNDSDDIVSDDENLDQEQVERLKAELQSIINKPVSGKSILKTTKTPIKVAKTEATKTPQPAQKEKKVVEKLVTPKKIIAAEVVDEDVSEKLTKSPQAEKTPKKKAKEQANASPIKSPANIANIPAKTPVKVKGEDASAKTPAKEAIPVKTPSKETTAPVKTPAKEVAAPVKTPAKQAAAPVKTPAKQAAAPVKTPAKEASPAPVKTPAKEAAPAPVKTPAKEAAPAPVKTPAKEAAPAPVKTPAKAAPAPVKTPAKETVPVQTPAKEAAPAPVKTPAKAAPAPVKTPAKEAAPAPVKTPAKGAAAAPIKTPAKIKDAPAPVGTPSKTSTNENEASVKQPGDIPVDEKKAITLSKKLEKKKAAQSKENQAPKEETESKEVKETVIEDSAVDAKAAKALAKRLKWAQKKALKKGVKTAESNGVETDDNEISDSQLVKKESNEGLSKSVVHDMMKHLSTRQVDRSPKKKSYAAISEEERSVEVRKKLVDSGKTNEEIERELPRIMIAIQRRLKDTRCLRCRQKGHMQRDCPVSKGRTPNKCYKCGDTTHNVRDCSIKEDVYTYADCFICHQTGHLTRTCPSNAKGIYPHGGGCFKCGDKTHLAKLCPGAKRAQDDNEAPEKMNKKAVVGVLNSKQSADADITDVVVEKAPIKKALKQGNKKQVVKF